MATLELKYSADQQYQINAVTSVCDLFRGQEFMSGEFLAEVTGERGLFDTVGHSNGMRLSAQQLETNLHSVQEENALAPTDVLTDGRLRDFTVDVRETRTEIERELEDGTSVSYDPPRYDIDYDASLVPYSPPLRPEAFRVPSWKFLLC